MAGCSRFVDVEGDEFGAEVERVHPSHSVYAAGGRVWIATWGTAKGKRDFHVTALSADDARALGQRLIELAGGAAPGEPPR